MAAQLPSEFGTALEYSNYIKGLAETPSTFTTGYAPFQATERALHDSLFNNVAPRASADKVFVQDTGNWNTAANWYPAVVPVAGENVLIGEGVVVTYNLDGSATSLGFVRIDGELTFLTSMTTHLKCETLCSETTGTFRIATETNPLNSIYTATVEFTNSDINVATDPYMIGHGAIFHGPVYIYGNPLTKVFERCNVATGPKAGDSSMVLASNPGWASGDTVAIPSVKMADWTNWPSYTRDDETVTLTGAQTATISWTGTLANDHHTTGGGGDPAYTYSRTTLAVHAANLTRNIRFIGADVDAVARQRPHFMLMHSHHGFDIRYAEFTGLGRTSKRFGWGGSMATPQTVSAPSFLTLDGPLASYAETNFCLSIGWSGTATVDVVGKDENNQDVTVPYTGGASDTRQWRSVTSIQVTSGTATNILVNVVVRSFELVDNSGSVAIENRNSKNGETSYYTYDDTHTSYTNARGRYAFHIHHGDLSPTAYDNKQFVKGIVVNGTPGWGIVQHENHTNFVDCIVWDFAGGGMVAEAGNETGVWDGCFVGSCQNALKQAQPEILKNPFWSTNGERAGQGVAFWFTGRMVKVVDCVAASAIIGAGYNVRFRDKIDFVEETTIAQWQFEQPRATMGLTGGDSLDRHPIQHFNGFEAYGMDIIGWHVIKAQATQFHGVRSFFKDIICWSCAYGLEPSYTAAYTFVDCAAISVWGEPAAGVGLNKNKTGFIFGTNTWDQVLDNFWVEGFEQSIFVSHAMESDQPDDSLRGKVIVDATIDGLAAATNTGLLTYKNELGFPFDEEISYATANSTYNTQVIATADLGGGSLSLTYPAPTYSFNVPFTVFFWTISTKTDTVDTREFPYFGRDSVGFQPFTLNNMVGYEGYFTTAGGTDYVLMPFAYNDSFNNTPALEVVAIDAFIHPNFTALYNGIYDSADSTPPVINSGADINVGTESGVPLTLNICSPTLPSPYTTHAGGKLMWIAYKTEPDRGKVGLGGTNNGIGAWHSDGTVTYYPLKDYTGTESFKVFVFDQNGNQDETTVNVTVSATGTQVAVSASDDSATTDFDTAVTFDVLSNDIGTETPFSITDETVTGGASVGTVTSSGNDLTFTPAVGTSGIAVGTYEVTDDSLNTDTANWSVTVAEEDVPEQPEGPPEITSGGEDRVSFHNHEVKTIDIGPLHNVSLSIIDATIDPTNAGDMDWAGTNIQITPKKDFWGNATVRYTATDGSTELGNTVPLRIFRAGHNLLLKT